MFNFNLPDFDLLIKWAAFGVFAAITIILGVAIFAAWFVYSHVVFV